MKTRLFFISSAIVAILCSMSHAVLAGEKVVVFTPEAVNVEPAVAQAVSATMAAEIESRGYTAVVHRGAESLVDEQYLSVPEPPPPPPPPPPPAAEPVEPQPSTPSSPDEFPAAEQPAPAPSAVPLTKEEMESKIATDMGASYYFTGTLVRLGKQMQLSVWMNKASGETVAQEKMAARTEDDLPIVIGRITEALLQQKSVEETRNLDNATRAETQNLPQRFRLEKNFGVVLGHAFGLGDMRDFTQIAFDGRFEFNDIIAEINAGMAVGNDGFADTQLIFDLAMSYYLIHKPISPYIGAGFGMFIGDRMDLNCDDDTDWEGDSVSCETSSVGWNLFPLMGLEFLRQSSIRVHVDFRYLFDFAGDAFGHAPMILAGINF